MQESKIGRNYEKPVVDHGDRALRQKLVARVVDDVGRAEPPLAFGNQQMEREAQSVRSAQRENLGAGDAAARRAGARGLGAG